MGGGKTWCSGNWHQKCWIMISDAGPLTCPFRFWALASLSPCSSLLSRALLPGVVRLGPVAAPSAASIPCDGVVWTTDGRWVERAPAESAVSGFPVLALPPVPLFSTSSLPDRHAVFWLNPCLGCWSSVTISDHLNVGGLTSLATRAAAWGCMPVNCTEASGGQNPVLALITRTCAQARKALWNWSLQRGVPLWIYTLAKFICVLLALCCLQVRIALWFLPPSWLLPPQLEWSLLFSCSSCWNPSDVRHTSSSLQSTPKRQPQYPHDPCSRNWWPFFLTNSSATWFSMVGCIDPHLLHSWLYLGVCTF